MSKENSEIIYHYTSVEGFLNILRSKTLWVSSLTEMNDSHEGVLHLPALKEAQQYIPLKVSDIYEKYPESINECSIEIQEGLDDIHKHIISQINLVLALSSSHVSPHICCFSHCKDKLSQWRGYGDDGKGIAIGFNRNKLQPKQDFHLGQDVRKSVEEVIYKYDEQVLRCKDFIKDFQNKVLDNTYNLLSINNSIPLKKEQNNQISKYVLENLSNLPLIFKNESFIEEEEVRLIYQAKNFDSAKYRCVNGNIISYFEHSFSPDAVEELIIGPKCRLKIDSKDFKNFLSKEYDHLLEEVRDLTEESRPINTKFSKFEHISFSKSTYR
ncbi:DUF2971 domain-containing protein [Pseudoalteromonas sp. MTN2-4]|uniref:DUF2971 domain-containing protein n=1 Tax=Pseudoalteromonas sp. MTN2-4 TaxID=3056555 RepID=UPI0036F2EEBA